MAAQRFSPASVTARSTSDVLPPGCVYVHAENRVCHVAESEVLYNDDVFFALFRIQVAADGGGAGAPPDAPPP